MICRLIRQWKLWPTLGLILSLIAVVVLLMAVRVGMDFHFLIATATPAMGRLAELLTLLISLMMLVGVVLMGRFFATRYSPKPELQQPSVANVEHWRALAENTNDGILVNQDGKHVFANQRIAQLLECTVEDLIGTSIQEVVHPEIAKEIAQRFQQRMKGVQVPNQYETVFITKGGKSVPVELTAAKTTWYGRPAAMAAIRDIRERKRVEAALAESEERYRVTFEQATVGIAHADLEGRFIHANRRFCDITAYSESELKGLSFADITHPDDLEEDLQNVERLRTGRIATYSMEKRYLRKDGRIIWVYLTTTYFRDHDGSPKYYIAVVQNIDALKQAERQRDRFFELAADMLCIADFDGRFVDLSRAWEHTLGYSRTELVSQPVIKFVHPDDRRKTESEMQYLIEGLQNTINFTNRYQNKAGGFCHLTWKAFADTQRQEIYAVAHDITELRQAEEALRKSHDELEIRVEERTRELSQEIAKQKQTEKSLLESEQRFRNMADGAPALIWLADRSNKGIWFNKRWLEYTGRSLAQELGDGWAEHVHPEDQERCINTCQSAFDARETFEIEFRLRRHDGTYGWIADTGIPRFSSDGSFEGYIGYCWDISERKEAQQTLQESEIRHRTVITSIVDGLITVDEKGVVESFNPAAERIFGYSADEVLGKNVKLLIPEPYQGQHDGYLRTYAKTRKSVIIGKGREVMGRTKDGTIFLLDLAVTEMWFGEKQKFVAVVRDITQRKKIEHAVVEAKEEAERANYAKSEFLSRMSHELRTPLNAILGFGELLATDDESALTAKQKDNVIEILHAGKHLLDLINEILDLARIESGGVTLHLEAVDIGELLEECWGIIKPMAQQRGIILEFGNLNAFNVLLTADRIRLKQVMFNLLSNAVKYNTSNGTVRVAWEAAGKRHVRVNITDSGPGIQKDKQAELFKSFNRLGAEQTGVEGTGIGLVITKRLVELMGGEIGVYSQIGRGTTFWFTLPRAAQESNVSGEEHADSFESFLATDAVKRCKVLYVEDNPANLKLVVRLLEKFPEIKLISADTAEHGLDLALRERPDLILLDIHLPGIDGYTVLQKLRARERTRTIPVVAVSADVMGQSMETAKAAGFAAYLAKPVDVSKLYRLVEKLLYQDVSVA